MMSHPGLPDDVTMAMVPLTMGHRHMTLPGYMMTSGNRSITSGLLTDVTVRMVTLGAYTAVQHRLHSHP